MQKDNLKYNPKKSTKSGKIQLGGSWSTVESSEGSNTECRFDFEWSIVARTNPNYSKSEFLASLDFLNIQ